MVECFKCGFSATSSEMLECVHKTGIVYVCHKCYSKLRIPIIERKKIDWSEVDERKPVRKRLSEISKVEVLNGGAKEKEKNPEDMTLKDIVQKNFEKNKVYAKENHDDLIDNFNWIIMRKRRSMKMSLSEFSSRIHEPEEVVSSLEKGFLPKDYVGVIRKVESALGVRLFRKMDREIGSDDIVAESKVPTGILVSEVKEKSGFFKNLFKKRDEVIQDKIDQAIKEAEEEEIDAKELDLGKVEEVFGKPVEEEKRIKEKPSKKEAQAKGKVEEEDLSQDEIDNLIWRS